MKASKFSEVQIAFVMKQADAGTAIGEVRRKARISEATFYNWRKRYGGMMPSEVKPLRQPTRRNTRWMLAVERAAVSAYEHRPSYSGPIGLWSCRHEYGGCVSGPERRCSHHTTANLIRIARA